MRKLDEKALAAAVTERRIGSNHVPRRESYEAHTARIVNAYLSALSATPSEGGDGALRDILRRSKDYLVDHYDPEDDALYRLRADIDAALALPAAAGWAVKPLEWVLDDHDSEWWATPNDLFGYEVRVGGSGKTRIRSPSTSGWQDFDGNVGDAKVAFQADFERRIRSALSAPTSKTGGDPASTGAGDD